MTDTPAGAPYRPAYIRTEDGKYYRLGVSTTMDVPTAHSQLSGLDQGDDHPQYLLPTEIIAGTNITVDRDSFPGSVKITGNAVAGVTDHGALTGLGDDDHTQYLTNERGDSRYLSKYDDSTTDGEISLTGLHINDTPEQDFSEITFQVDFRRRWTIRRNAAPENEEDGASATGSNLEIIRHNNGGNYYPPAVVIDRNTGAVLVTAALTESSPDEQVVTLGYIKSAGAQGNLVLVSGYKNLNDSYSGQLVTTSGMVVTLDGMVGFSVNKPVTANTEYLIGTLPNIVGVTPTSGRIWNGGMYSFTGSAATSIGCRLRINPSNGGLYFMPPGSGTFTTNGWVSFMGSWRRTPPITIQ
jgi:hypothetical protein